MDKPDQLTRICSACGVKKSLSAFLHIGGIQGTTYGTICSECRRTGAKSSPKNIESGERSSSSSGVRIGSQQKVALDTEKKQLQKNLKESQHKEEQTKDEVKSEKELRDELKLKAEKDHRKFYIEPKRQGFLTRSTQTVLSKIENAKKLDRDRVQVKQTEELDRQVEEKKVDETISLNLQLNTMINVALPFLPALFHQKRFQSPLFRQYLRWLGENAPIARTLLTKNLDQLYKKVSETENMKPSDKLHQSAKKIEKNSLLDMIDQALKPSSRKP